MLARLDRLAGVAESRVDWEGKHVLVRLSSGAGPGDVAARAASILGKGAVRLEGPEAAACLASYRRGDSWMRAGETIRLSRHEAGILGSRFARESAEAATLDSNQAKRLEGVLTEEIGALFERMHASGTRPDDVKAADLAVLERRLRERIGEFATAVQVDTIIETLKANLGMCEQEEQR